MRKTLKEIFHTILKEKFLKCLDQLKIYWNKCNFYNKVQMLIWRYINKSVTTWKNIMKPVSVIIEYASSFSLIKVLNEKIMLTESIKYKWNLSWEFVRCWSHTVKTWVKFMYISTEIIKVYSVNICLLQ